MAGTSAKPLSRPAVLYISAVAAAGIPLGAYCAYVFARDGFSTELLVFVALTLISGRFTVKVPSVSAHFSPSEMFSFASVLLFGPEVGAITLAVDGVIVSLQRRMTLPQTVFNFSSLALSAWISGVLFFKAAGVAPLFTAMAPSSGLLLPLGLLAVSYFVINTGLTATAIALATGRSALLVWRQFLWLGPGYAAGACVALLLVVALHQVHFSALLLLPPVTLVFYATLRASFGRQEDAKGHVEALNRMYLSTVETLATAIDAKDEVTHGHVRRVQTAAVALAREMGISDEMSIKAIEAAALLHDTGKIAVPEHILNKPGKLTPAEFEKMKLHAPIGADILSAIEFPFPVVPIVRHHHENWDGTGYPDGIKATDIPIGARILSVVDCYDALTSDRPYRRRMTDQQATAILVERRGTMYDPAVIDVFLRTRHQIMPAQDLVVHPIARTLDVARELLVEQTETSAVPDSKSMNEVLAVASLARAVSGQAGLADVGALAWMMLRQMVPCASMGLFLYDEADDCVTARYADGLHAPAVRGRRLELGAGVAGWCAANKRFVLNADPVIDLGASSASLTPPLRSSLTVPLSHEGAVTGVLTLYASTPDAFTDNDARLLTLLAPSLASSIAALPKSTEWEGVRRRPAAGELRLLKRS